MALPDLIAVRYTEEEAGYVSFRPVVRQNFRMNELLDMVLSVTGKHPDRIQQIFRSGTVAYHSYRYWWDGFDAAEADLLPMLASFPDPDPTRAFPAADCTAAIVEGGIAPRHSAVEFSRDAASRKGLFQRRSFWDELLALAAAGPLSYESYSYTQRGDLYKLELTSELRTKFATALSLASRNLRKDLAAVQDVERIMFVCPRVRS